MLDILVDPSGSGSTASLRDPISDEKCVANFAITVTDRSATYPINLAVRSPFIRYNGRPHSRHLTFDRHRTAYAARVRPPDKKS